MRYTAVRLDPQTLSACSAAKDLLGVPRVLRTPLSSTPPLQEIKSQFSDLHATIMAGEVDSWLE